ncbi:hypothetical protein [Elioraea sp.]|uniref:hypothetical protein n=2 Tax=Elioraea sp. TaxID=2185103 RepID=UPI0021DBBADE|nr:hypothetical protein [Elioraea sp.]GIX09282.1 MAG: hypothetical protein KatS3mg116_0992 [Elioraea sp.]
MKLPDLLPPRDLLDRLGGVAEGLRTHARFGRVPVALGVAAAVVQVLAALDGAGLIAKWSEAVAALRAWASGSAAPPPLDWAIALLAALLVAALVVWRAWRGWLVEAATPLRYTFSIGPFVPVDGQSGDPHLAWLPHDLAVAVARRIPRLTAMAPEQVADPLASSHFHITGSVLIRRDAAEIASSRPLRRTVVEIVPRVRLGGPGAPETIAPLVRYRISPRRSAGQRAGRPEQHYGRILERTAYSVASAIYARLREDVARKVEALPVRRHRAAAYLREAEDWARSSTLNGYDDALALLRRAMAEADPRRRPPAPTIWSGLATLFARARAELADATAPALARCLPGLGRRALLIGRIETAFARTVALRELQQVVVSVSAPGREGRATVFAARFEAEAAVARLAALPARVPGRAAALQDAHAALALACARLSAAVSAHKAAMAARDADPIRFESDPMCQYARGDAEASPHARLRLFRRALQLDPRHEPAQLMLAYDTERLWRQETALDRDAAERLVLPEYERLLDLNGGATAGHANAGHVCWLMAGGDLALLDRAIELFEEGLAAHELEPASAAAEMHFGLGRALAEAGRLAEAQGHLLEGLAALSGDRNRSDFGFRPYLFMNPTPALLARFTCARRRVQAHAARSPSAVADSVLAMAHLDEAEAALALAEATGDPEARLIAELAWRQAGLRSPDNILYAFLGFRSFAGDARRDLLETVLEVRAPQWRAAMLLRADRHAAQAARRWQEAAAARAEGGQATAAALREAEEHRRLAMQIYRGLLPQAWLWRSDQPADPGEPGDAALHLLAHPRSRTRRRPWTEEIDPIGVETLAAMGLRAVGHAEVLRRIGRRRLAARRPARHGHDPGWPDGLRGVADLDRAEARRWYRQGWMLISVARLLYEPDRPGADWPEDAELRRSWNGWRSRAMPASVDTATWLVRRSAEGLPAHVRRIVRAARDAGHVLAELLRGDGRIAGATAAMLEARRALDAWIAGQARQAGTPAARFRLADVMVRLEGRPMPPWRLALQLRAAAARRGPDLLAWLPDAVALAAAAEEDPARLAREASWLGLIDPGFEPPPSLRWR